jgi:glycerophosphoryl diester phosphodiesterase
MVTAVTLTPVAAQATAGCGVATIAHRGYHRHHAENTRKAWGGALQRGADVVEGDLRRTRDDKLVVIHDARLARTTNGRGLVRRRTGRYIRSLRTNDGQRVPYLTQFVRFLRKHPQMHGALELKGGTSPALRLLDRRVTRARVARRLTFSSLSESRLRAVKRLIPQAHQQLISLRHRRQATRVNDFASRISLPLRKLSSAYVRRLHRHGVRVQLRASHRARPHAWNTAMRMDVDAISTDALPELISTCRTFFSRN